MPISRAAGMILGPFCALLCAGQALAAPVTGQADGRDAHPTIGSVDGRDAHPTIGSVDGGDAHPRTGNADDGPAPVAMSLRDYLTAAIGNPDNANRWSLTADQAEQNAIVTQQAFRPTFTARANTSIESTSALLPMAQTQLLGSERLRGALIGNFTLLDGGKRKYDLAAARAGVDLANATNENNALTILMNASYAYYNALWLQQAVDSARQQVVAAQENLKDTQERYTLGTAIRSDVLTASSAVDEAETTLKTEQTASSNANSTLAQIIDADPRQAFQLTSATAPEWPADESVDDVIRRIEKSSPGAKQLQDQVAVDQDKLSSIHASNRPVIAITGELGWAEFRNVVPPFNFEYSPYALFGATVTAPLFNEPAQRAKERSQADTVKLDKIAVEEYESTVRSQFVTALTTYKNASDSVDIAKDALNNASQAYDFARERYQIGRGTEPDVVQALQSLAEARDQYNQAVDFKNTAAQNLRWLAGLDLPSNFRSAVPSSPTSTGYPAIGGPSK